MGWQEVLATLLLMLLVAPWFLEAGNVLERRDCRERRNARGRVIGWRRLRRKGDR